MKLIFFSKIPFLRYKFSPPLPLCWRPLLLLIIIKKKKPNTGKVRAVCVGRVYVRRVSLLYRIDYI
jgi:hypothetical protein